MKKMLLIVDPQIDFISGSLPVPGAEMAIDALAEYVQGHGDEYSSIVVSCDRHPSDHTSFKSHGGVWPDHCVAGTIGACIWPRLIEALIPFAERTEILYKGETRTREEYSIFQSRKEMMRLSELFLSGIEDVDICGLAGDVCVAHTHKDLRLLFPEVRTRVLEDFTAYIS